MNLKIDSDFNSLCRKLSSDEYKQLEINIKADGCIDPIKICDDTIVDGHNRYAICKKHGINFKVTKLTFKNNEEAKIWIIDNQLGRRNLTDLDRVALLEAKRPILEAQARERKGQRTDLLANLPKGSKVDLREDLAKEAKVSGHTYEALRKVNLDGSDELKQAVREKEVSASRAVKIAELPKEKQKEAMEEMKENKILKKEDVRAPDKPRRIGSYQDWKVYREKAKQVLIILKEMSTLKVDADRIFQARQYAEEMQEQITKILKQN